MSLQAVPDPVPEPASCVSCERLRNAINLIEVDAQNAEMALRSERRRTNLLQGQLDKALDESAAADEVKEIFNIWRGTTGHHRSKLMAERKKLIGRMLKNYGRDRCIMAVLGVHEAAWTNPKTGVRYDQIQHIFGDEERFERFERAGRKACGPQLERKRRGTPLAQALIQSGMRYVEDESLQVFHFDCPVCHADYSDPQGIYKPLLLRYDGKHGYCTDCNASLSEVWQALHKTQLIEVA